MSSQKSAKSVLFSLCTALFAVLGVGYIVGLALFIVLRMWSQRPPLVALASVFAPFLFVPLILILPLSWLARSRVAQVSALAALGLFVALYGPLFLPRLSPAPVQARLSLTAMAFNLGAHRPEPEQLVSAIESEDADIVAVEELIRPVADVMEQRLGERYPYRILKPRRFSTGLLSRYPILEHQWLDLAGTGQPVLDAVLDVGGTRMHVLVLHPYRPGISWYKGMPLPIGLHDEGPQLQAADVARYAAGLDGPVLVMGDFNLADQNRAYAELSGVLKDAWREAGWGFGFTFPHGLRFRRLPVPGPLIRIDYIFYSDQLYAERAEVGCKGGSDHCYVVARLGLH